MDGEIREMNPRPEYGLLRLLVEPKLAKHPRPWRIDHDWTVEVLDAAGGCVLKCHNQLEAEMLIGLAGDADDEHELYKVWYKETFGEETEF